MKRLKRIPEKLLSSAIKQAADSVMITNRDGIIIYVNHAFERVTGYTFEEAVGKSPRILKSGKHDKQFYEQLWTTILGGKVFRGIIINKSKKDEYFVEQKTISPIFNKNGKISYFVCSGKIITEYIKAKEELLESEFLYTQLMQQSLEAIYLLDLETKQIIDANRAFLNWLGYTRNDIRTMKNYDFVAENLGEINYNMQKLSKGEGFVIGEWRWRKKNGKIIYVELTASVIRKKEKLIGFFCGRDITEKKIAEEKRKSLEEQLFQAQKLEGIGTLASGIAHDFNNILGIILGQVSMFENSKKKTPQKLNHCTKSVTRSAERGSSLVKQLLTFARKTKVQFTGVNINHIIKEIKKLLSETFPKTIFISDILRKEIPPISANPTQIQQMLFNLCLNARDAMTNGGTLSLKTQLVKKNEQFAQIYQRAVFGEYIEIQVGDTGTGMDESTRLRLFEPFFTTKEIGKGTGLGLSVTYGIVMNHKGFIDVESEPGKGTIFKIYLPVLPVAEIKETPGEEYPDNKKSGKGTILLIEDEPMLLEVGMEILESTGCKIIPANDGEEGYLLWSAHKDEIDLIVSDIGLPKINGYDLYKKIAQEDNAVKMILISGYIDPQMRSEILKAGVLQVIEKPYSPTLFVETIQNVLG